LMTPEQLEETWKLRNNMSGDSLEYTDQFIKMLKRTQNNQQLFEVFHDVSFGKQIKRNPKR
ncbi:MAG: transcription termination factor Rho, partial [Enterococcus sp.]|nr:transcription termination factor Rho [Enterococcus sp.]